MKFKQVDCVIQIVLIVGALLVNLMGGSRLLDSSLIPSYFVVGGWQMISVLVHLGLPASYKSGTRRIYLWLLAATAAITIIVFAIGGRGTSDEIIVYMFCMLFWTALLAVFYLIICGQETRRLTADKNMVGETTNTP